MAHALDRACPAQLPPALWGLTALQLRARLPGDGIS